MSLMPAAEAETAADVVRWALSRLDQQDASDSGKLVAAAAAELAAAVADGTVPLALVLAALQAGLLNCAASAADELPSANVYAEHLSQLKDNPPSSEGDTAAHCVVTKGLVSVLIRFKRLQMVAQASPCRSCAFFWPGLVQAHRRPCALATCCCLRTSSTSSSTAAKSRAAPRF